MDSEFVIMPPPKTMMPSAAPKAAPCETPSVEAEARGLRSTHCITAPDEASSAPMTIAARARGRRMFITAVTCFFSAVPKKTRRISMGLSRMEPIPMYQDHNML